MTIRLATVTSRLVISVSQSAKRDLVRLLGLLPSKVWVTPLDLSQLARALERVLGDSDLQGSMREESLKQAARFSWERTAKETLAVYRQVLSR